MNEKNTVFLSIAIVVVIIVAGGIFWYSQKVQKDIAEISQKQNGEIAKVEEKIVQKNDVNDISNWKTYRNEKYGIQFRYPNDENHWVVREYDHSKDSSDGYYPSKGILVEYKYPESSEVSGGEHIAFSVVNSRYGSKNTFRHNPNNPDNYTFQFNGQLAVAEKIRKDAITGFMENDNCNIGNIIFTLPNLSAIWTSDDTISVLCGSSKAPKENPRIFRKILDTVEFF